MAELTLAIIPLIVSAVKHYSDVSKAVSRYRHYSDHIDEFFSEVNVQCRIFQTSLQLLLASAVGDEQAASMLQDEKHLGWEDGDLDSYMSDRFPGANASAAKSCLDLIRRQTVKILDICRGFEEIVDEVEQDGTASLRKKTRRIGKKVNMACSKGRIDTVLKTLRDRTQDFRVLVQQTERLAAKSVLEEPNQLTKAKVRRFLAVKSAANNLYTAFGRACTKHTEHQGYIGLEPMQNDTHHVNFVLAFKSLTIQPTPTSKTTPGAEVLWFSIESTVVEATCPTASTGVLASLQTSAKRTLELSPLDQRRCAESATKTQKTKKSVTFRMNPVVDCILTSTARLPTKICSSDSLMNLCSHNNFCNQVQKVFKQSKLPEHRCIGYLENGGGSKHLVYVHSKMNRVTTVTQGADVVALGKLLQEASASVRVGGLQLPYKRIRLGRQLALALLQFHQTCWLRDSWSSDDILISDADDNIRGDPKQVQDTASESYANVSIREQVVPEEQQVARPLPYIRNRALFNLGKILLELAFQKRFHQFDKPDDLEPNLTDDSVDFFTAKRLLCTVSAELGARFARVIERCIECDFAHGSDLNSELLQASFYQYVICELERCERLVSGL